MKKEICFNSMLLPEIASKNKLLLCKTFLFYEDPTLEMQ